MHNSNTVMDYTLPAGREKLACLRLPTQFPTSQTLSVIMTGKMKYMLYKLYVICILASGRITPNLEISYFIKMLCIWWISGLAYDEAWA